MVWLKRTRSRNPMPRRDFGVHNHSQQRQCIFFFSSSKPHQWSAIALRRVSHVEIGIWKQLIMNIGIACMKALSKVSFPALDMGRSDQPFVHFHALSRIALNELAGDLPTPVGIPRQVSWSTSLVTPNQLVTLPLIRVFQWKPKNTEDLSQALTISIQGYLQSFNTFGITPLKEDTIICKQQVWYWWSFTTIADTMEIPTILLLK
jgi:hypothetical protein